MIFNIVFGIWIFFFFLGVSVLIYNKGKDKDGGGICLISILFLTIMAIISKIFE